MLSVITSGAVPPVAAGKKEKASAGQFLGKEDVTRANRRSLCSREAFRLPGVADYHSSVTIPFAGAGRFQDVSSYFAFVRDLYLPLWSHVKKPLLAIQAVDDPIIPPHVCRPVYDECEKGQGVVQVITQRGGHAGFFEGLRGASWSDKVSLQFLESYLSTVSK